MGVTLTKVQLVIRHKTIKCNKVVDALSRWSGLLTVVSSMITHMESLQKLYKEDADFYEPWRQCLQHTPNADFSIRNGYLFKGNQLVFLTLFLVFI